MGEGDRMKTFPVPAALLYHHSRKLREDFTNDWVQGQTMNIEWDIEENPDIFESYLYTLYGLPLPMKSITTMIQVMREPSHSTSRRHISLTRTTASTLSTITPNLNENASTCMKSTSLPKNSSISTPKIASLLS